MTSVDYKICTTCLGRKPLDMFRRRRAGSEERRHERRDCHRAKCGQWWRDKSAKTDRRSIAAAMAEARRRKSSEAILAVFRQIADKMGGVNRFTARFVGLAEHPETPMKWRIKTCHTLLEIAVLAEQGSGSGRL